MTPAIFECIDVTPDGGMPQPEAHFMRVGEAGGHMMIQVSDFRALGLPGLPVKGKSYRVFVGEVINAGPQVLNLDPSREPQATPIPVEELMKAGSIPDSEPVKPIDPFPPTEGKIGKAIDKDRWGK